MRSAKPAGMSPAIAALKRKRSGCAHRRSSHASRSARERSPAARQAAMISAGTSKGACGQASLARAASISAAPSGAPWVASVPCLLGAPNPITVRQSIIVGRSWRFASASAASIAAGSWPSIAIVCQPAAAKRARWSMLVESEVEPSMVIWLSSHNTIRRESLRWPARSIASWLTPSIRQPSPAMT